MTAMRRWNWWFSCRCYSGCWGWLLPPAGHRARQDRWTMVPGTLRARRRSRGGLGGGTDAAQEPTPCVHRHPELSRAMNVSSGRRRQEADGDRGAISLMIVVLFVALAGLAGIVVDGGAKLTGDENVAA